MIVAVSDFINKPISSSIPSPVLLLRLFSLNQTLFPTAQPESHQETLPLPGSAEPKWPHVSFGNETDVPLFIFFIIIQLYSQPVFTCFG